MVMAQLAEQFAPMPEVRGSNRVIVKIYNELTIYCWKDKIKKQRPGMARLKEVWNCGKVGSEKGSKTAVESGLKKVLKLRFRKRF